MQSDTAAVTGFIANLAAFFAGARERVANATTMVQEIEAFPPTPRTPQEDAMVQAMVVSARGARKENGEYWGICQVVGRLHKKLTGGRARAGEKFDLVITKGEAMHASWLRVEAQRIAREEAERRRLAEEEEARKRAQEAAELESQKLAAEEASSELSERERHVIGFMLVRLGPDAPAAREDWIRAAESAKYVNPVQQGERFTHSEKMNAALDAAQRALALEDQQRAAAIAAAAAPPPTIAPVETQTIKVSRGRTSYSAEILDKTALINAILAGGPAAPPAALLTIDETYLNLMARQMPGVVKTWPGVRVNERTSLY